MALRLLLFAAGGGGLGYGWYRLMSCPGGACPFTRNPYVSTLWGAAMGLMLAAGRQGHRILLRTRAY